MQNEKPAKNAIPPHRDRRTFFKQSPLDASVKSPVKLLAGSKRPHPETAQQEPFPLPDREAIMKMAPFAGLTLHNIHLVTSEQKTEEALGHLLGCQVVGFDTESRPTFRKGEISEGPHVLQFATLQRAYIFQTCQPDCAPAMEKLFAAKKLLKVGFGLADDIKRIAGKFSLVPHGIIDLNHTFKVHFRLRNSIGAKSAIALLLNRRFIKSHKSTTSNWSNTELSPSQLLYAANDAFAALAVYEALAAAGITIRQ